MKNGVSYDPRQGISGPVNEWLEFNAYGAFALEGGLGMVAPFPPPDLMMDTSGLRRPEDFAMHGLLIGRPFVEACPVPLNTFKSILDFGVGVGRLARMFKGFAGTYIGVDIDRRNIEWITENLEYVAAVRTVPRRALPFGDGFFDAAVSVSVFTHMNLADSRFYLDELRRVVKSDGYILISLHGERALRRAHDELQIGEMLRLNRDDASIAMRELTEGDGFCFFPQHTHLTSANYDYGITFVSQDFIERSWGSRFSEACLHSGVIADFQDIAVFRNS